MKKSSRKPDRTKTIDLFDKITGELPKRMTPLSATQKPLNSEQKYIKKLHEKQFDKFISDDWIRYFRDKAKSKGIKFLRGNVIKERTILNALMKKLTPEEIKVYIDFIFDSNQEIVDKRTVGIWIFSGGWINTIYQHSQLWIKGETKNVSKNREWIEENSQEEKKVRF